jgi:hypothetical protein
VWQVEPYRHGPLPPAAGLEGVALLAIVRLVLSAAAGKAEWPAKIIGLPFKNQSARGACKSTRSRTELPWDDV